jgi:hypothetical protein
VPPKPGVFDGGAGFARALAFGFAAGSTAAAITSFVVATKKGDDARGILGKLQQKVGASPCIQGSPNLAIGCQEVTALNQAHDNRGALAAGLFVAAGVAGAAATASIWLPRTPSTPAVQVTPTAPGSAAGITVNGLW